MEKCEQSTTAEVIDALAEFVEAAKRAEMAMREVQETLVKELNAWAEYARRGESDHG